LKKALDSIDTFIKYFLVLIVAAVSILGFYQVVTRYVFNNASTWSEELIRFLFIWASCIGAGMGVKENIHIGIDVVVNLFPKKPQMVLRIFVLCVLCAFGAFLIKYGLVLTTKTARQISPALRISMAYVYSAIPTLGVFTAFYCIREILSVIQGVARGGTQ